MSELLQKIQLIEQDVQSFVAPLQSFQITSDEENALAAEYLSQVKKRVKRIEELRVFFVKPLNDQVSEINKMFKPQASPLIAIEAKIKEEMKRYFIQEETKKKAELEEKLKAQEKLNEELKQTGLDIQITNLEVVDSVKMPEKSIKSSSGTVSHKKVWTYEVVDLNALRAARPDLFELDRAKVTALVREGVRELEGVRIYEDVQISART